MWREGFSFMKFIKNFHPRVITLRLRSTYSYVWKDFIKKLITPPFSLKLRVIIGIWNNISVIVSKEYANVIVECYGVSFQENLIPMKIRGFDVSLGMDWLLMYEAKKNLVRSWCDWNPPMVTWFSFIKTRDV